MTDERDAAAGSSVFSDLDRPPLDVDRLRRTLRVGAPAAWWRALDVVEATASTNADLGAAARAGAEEATVLVAEHQTAGRGRLGRAWQAPPRSALTLSVLVRPGPALAPNRWPWLPLLAGTAVAEAVRRGAGVDGWLKWPNDVVVDDRKLAGLLVERVDTPAGAAAVVGIGLNVSLRANELSVPTATSLSLEGGVPADRQALLPVLLRAFESLYRAWMATGGDPAELYPAYLRRCCTPGRRVTVALPDGSTVEGTAETIDPDGRLVVGTPGGRRALGAGDVVHVRPQV